MAAMIERRIQGFGWRPDTPDHRDRVYELEEPILKPHELPRGVDLSAHMPPIYDQGQLGSCTGNGIARCLEYEAMRQGEPADTPSRLFIYYEERRIEGTVDQDAGAEIRDGIKVVATEGAPPESEWPYDITRFAEKPPQSAYLDAAKHEAIQYRRVLGGGPGAPVRTALASGLPIVFGFSVPASFGDGSWDPARQALPLPRPDEQIIGGHCVVIVGYDWTTARFSVPTFKCANSWGPDWGENGFFHMDYRWLTPGLGLANDLWVISRTS